MTRLALPAVLVVAAITAALARGEPGWALVGDGTAWTVLESAGGLALAAAGALMARRGERRSGTLMMVAAGAWLAAEWDNPGAPAAIFTIGIVVPFTAAAVIAHAILAEARAPAARAATTAGYLGLLIVAGFAAALFEDLQAGACSACPANLVGLVDAPGTAELLERGGLAVGGLGVVACAAFATLRIVRSSPAARWRYAPVAVPAVAFLALAAAGIVHHLPDGGDAIDATDERLRRAQALALVAVLLGVALQRLAAARLRRRLARLVVEMSAAARPGGLRERLATVLGDPTLEVLYAGERGWVDATGAPRDVDRNGERGVTPMVQDGEVTALVVHAPGLLDDPGVVEELGATARLAIDHERLQAQQRAQLERLRSARAASVAAADGERRRLERDLHDGAQQALAGLAMAIGLARASDGATADLARAQDHVRTALARVRALAHATYPAALDEAGLPAALDVLGDWRPHIEVGSLPADPLPPMLETSAYFIVAALTDPAAGEAVVEARREDGRLVIEVARTAAGGLGDVEDRAGALGGDVEIEDGGTRVRVTLPCA